MKKSPVPRSLVLLSTAVLLALCPASADPLPAQRVSADSLLGVDSFLDWEGISAPRISPDGSRIVYTRRRVDKVGDRWESQIWVMEADGSRHHSLVEGSSPRWSPDGTRIAYLAEGEPEGRQIFVRWMDERGGSTQITHVTQSPSDIRWGPDGERIAFTMDVPAGEEWSIPIPKAPEGAEWTKAPRLIDRIHYQFDGIGFLDEDWQHLFTVPADGGTPRQLTHGEWNVGATFEGPVGGATLSWSPDGETLVFDGLKAANPDTFYETSHVYAVDRSTRELEALTEEKGSWSGPVVSPDGRYVAFTGHPRTGLTHTPSDLWLVPLEGGDRRKITADLDRSPQDLHWAADGDGVYFTAEDEGSEHLFFASPDGDVEQLTRRPQVLGLSSVSDAGVAVGTRSRPQRPENVVRFDLEAPTSATRLTRVNRDVLRDVELGEVEEIWYRSEDGTRVQGWLVKPPGFDPGERYPLILHIHGGPHAMYDVGFSFRYQNFAANGYLVLYTNPRGSTGYGKEFAAAISQDYPSVDHQDLMAGVDTVVARGIVDTSRLFVTGCSGGGVLSSWAVGHTDRFAAAAVRCPVTDWLSMAGTTDIPLFTYKFFDQPFWKNPEPWLEHSSVMYAGEVQTPTLLMTGELDRRTPISQTAEFYQALKKRGVPTAMLRFRKEYHGTGSKPSNFIRGQLYMMDWFENRGRLEGISVPEGS